MAPTLTVALWSAELLLVAALAATPRGARFALVVAIVALALPAFADLPPFALALAATAVLASAPLMLGSGQADRAVIRTGGTVYAELPLTAKRSLEVPGPLGTTVIEIEPGRARVAADPGPRQYCVKQGWLARSNAIAICAPNEVSLALVGRVRTYDTINY